VKDGSETDKSSSTGGHKQTQVET